MDTDPIVTVYLGFSKHGDNDENLEHLNTYVARGFYVESATLLPQPYSHDRDEYYLVRLMRKPKSTV